MAAPAYDRYPPGQRVRFHGDTFRSRAEAKWACVFHQLGIPYQYEPEKYRLPSGSWKPDFWLPEQQAYVEVKPHDYVDARYRELGARTGALVFVVRASLPICPIGASPENMVRILAGRIWRKWPREAGRSFALVREASGHYSFAPLAPPMLCDPFAPEILTAYATAVRYHF